MASRFQSLPLATRCPGGAGYHPKGLPPGRPWFQIRACRPGTMLSVRAWCLSPGRRWAFSPSAPCRVIMSSVPHFPFRARMVPYWASSTVASSEASTHHSAGGIPLSWARVAGRRYRTRGKLPWGLEPHRVPGWRAAGCYLRCKTPARASHMGLATRGSPWSLPRGARPGFCLEGLAVPPPLRGSGGGGLWSPTPF